MTSSTDFARDWRFAIGKDFIKKSGDPYDYAKGGLKEWGQELLKIPFDHNPEIGPRRASISDDGRYLVMNTQFDIAVWDILDRSLVGILQGHVSDVDQLAFRPGHPTQLVSSAQNNFANTNPSDPTIIFWDLTRDLQKRHITQEDVELVARNSANTIIAELKSDLGPIDFGARDQKHLAKDIEQPIWNLVRSKAGEDKVKLTGRLTTNFQTQVFSPSGKYLCYMPGKAPEYNGDDDWVMRVYAVDEQKDALILSGNRDAIMWVGFNHDESLVGTTSWDKSFRVWDTKTGTQRFCWTTEAQNWAGGFSPDGKYFAGTSGNGSLYVYDLSDGSRQMSFTSGSGWARALSWHPTEPLIAVGGQGYGKLFLVEVSHTKNAIQRRILSPRASRFPPDDPDVFEICSVFLEVASVRFVDAGRKIAFYTSGDGSAEVYDIAQENKYRFARAGTMNPPGDDTPVTSLGGYDMLVHEYPDEKKVLVVSVDTHALRFWYVPMSS